MRGSSARSHTTSSWPSTSSRGTSEYGAKQATCPACAPARRSSAASNARGSTLSSFSAIEPGRVATLLGPDLAVRAPQVDHAVVALRILETLDLFRNPVTHAKRVGHHAATGGQMAWGQGPPPANYA